MYKFLSVDIKSATFTGISLKLQRKLALLVTLVIWVFMGVYALNLISIMNLSRETEDLLTVLAVGCLLVGLAGGPFVPLIAAQALFNHTPLGVVYRKDKVVLERAREELFRIAKTVDFADYLGYGKINPEIRCKKNLLVIAHQKKGDLELWAMRARNLHQLANLVYQIYLVEQLLSSDELNGSTCRDL